ncbi:MAG: methyltransferase [Chloroflexi bacterium]|nr:methyltransferase [Chloroflexota bacterium]
MTERDTTDQQAQQALRGLVLGFMATHRLYVAARLGVADILAAGPMALTDLAQSTGAHLSAFERLVDGLVADGVLARQVNGDLAPTPISDLLRRDHPASFRPMVLDLAGPHAQIAWTELEHTIKTGEPAFDRAHGVTMWEYHAAHPDIAANFNEFMVKWSHDRHQAVVDAYDFSGIATLADVGGGMGGYLSHIAKSYPSLKGILFDQPSLEQSANDYLKAQGVDDRCAFVGSSFFDSVPEGADAYFLAHVLHDWADDEVRAILRNCHRAMKPTDRLLIEEVLAVAGSGGNMVMMVNFGEAKNRTESEFRKLVEESGFKLTRTVPTTGDSTILEARLA